jgi:predicted membrane chloride channel (bestrophin family)
VIEYDAKSWISVLGRVRGTILPRVLPRVAVGATVGVVACWLYDQLRFAVPAIGHTLIGAALARAGLSDEAVAVRQRSFDETLGLFSDAFGGCERIRSTPVPFAYAHHIKLLVFLFCYTVPFVMVDSMGWITPIATAIVCFGLFGIDEIGVEIEDPFGTDPNDLPMERLIEHLEVSTREILAAIERSEESAERPREAA